MPTWLQILLNGLALLGHIAIGVWVFNRVQATNLPRPLIKAVELVAVILVPFGLLGMAWRMLGTNVWTWSDSLSANSVAVYCWVSAACGGAVFPLWVLPRLTRKRAAALLGNEQRLIDLTQRVDEPLAADLRTRIYAAIPGNQIFQLSITEKTLRLPRLPAELEGLRVVHLSDLHITGQATPRFYREIADLTNAADPDLVCISGDILENERCLPWIADTIGKVEAKHGKYYVVGNHEKKLPDVDNLRFALFAQGWFDLGSRCRKIRVRNIDMLAAGVELPWFGRTPELKYHSDKPYFRLLVSHTPDNLPWARQNEFDLMLAGHNHGGQICFPWIGPLVSPSRYGSRYAAGLFDEPPTVLHVSRGLFGTHPLRLSCPPELAVLTLTRG